MKGRKNSRRAPSPYLSAGQTGKHGRTQNTRKPNQQQEAVDCALLLKTDAGEAQGCQMGIPTRRHQAANFRSIHGRRKGRRRRRTDQPNRHSAFLTLQQHLPTSGQHREQVNAELLCAALPKNLPQSSSPCCLYRRRHSRQARRNTQGVKDLTRLLASRPKFTPCISTDRCPFHALAFTRAPTHSRKTIFTPPCHYSSVHRDTGYTHLTTKPRRFRSDEVPRTTNIYFPLSR